MFNSNFRGYALSIAVICVLCMACAGIKPIPSGGVAAGSDTNDTFGMLLISDLNGSYGALDYPQEVHQVISRLETLRPDMLLCAGDMIAGQTSSLSRSRLDSMWSSFDRQILSRVDSLGIPFGFTLGNHDASPGFPQDRSAAQAFWKSRRPHNRLNIINGKHYPFYFSYVQEGVFFISWDAAGAEIPSEVKQWMQKELASPAGKHARKRIVLGHLPLFALVEAKNKPGEVLKHPEEILAMFEQYGVDMYISGHQHAWFPGKKQGVVLFSSGCLGNGPRALLGDDRPPVKTYALLELDAADSLHIRTINASTGNVIPLESLPGSVEGFNGSLKRMDR